MRIICPKCETEYDLDATQLSPDGTPVQCSACEHTFSAYPATTSEDSSLPTARMPSADVQRATDPGRRSGEHPVLRRPGKAKTIKAGLGGTGGLVSRTSNPSSGVVPPPPPISGPAGRLFLAQGDRIYKVKDIATLQRWVVEKRVLPNDRLSRDGKSWDVVSSVAELRPFFSVLDQLKSTKKALSKARKQVGAPPAPPPKTERLNTPSQPVPRPEPPPPVLPADRPATAPSGNEAGSLEPQRTVVEMGSDVSASTATAAGPMDVRKLREEVGPSGVEAEVPTRAPLPAVAAPVEGPEETADPFDSQPFDPPKGAPADLPDVDGLDDDFFGVGDGDEASRDAPASGGVGATQPVPVGAKTTRAFEVPGTTQSSDSLPMPETVHVETRAAADDFDPDQTFSDIEAVRRPAVGPGLGFLAVLLVCAVLILGGAWYLLLGPGRSAVFGGPEPVADTGAKPGEVLPPTSTAPEPAPAPEVTPSETGDEATTEPEASTPKAEPSTPKPEPSTPKAEPSTPKAEPSTPKSEPSTPKPRTEAPAPVVREEGAPALIKAGNRARDRGDFRGAVEAYRSAVAADPSNSRVQMDLGWSLVELGNNSDAAAAFKKAVSLNPGLAEAHYGLGLAYQGQGRRADAAAEYRRVIELDPGGRDTREVQALLSQLE